MLLKGFFILSILFNLKGIYYNNKNITSNLLRENNILYFDDGDNGDDDNSDGDDGDGEGGKNFPPGDIPGIGGNKNDYIDPSFDGKIDGNINKPNDTDAIDSRLNPGISYSKRFNLQYFKYLKDNIIQNDSNICGYTAMSMLFSYYDNYWNDNFLPDKYESSSSFYSEKSLWTVSPGCDNKRDGGPLIIDDSMTEDKKNDVVKDFFDKNVIAGGLFGELLTIAKKLGYIEFKSPENDHYQTSLGVSLGLMVDVITEYLNRYIGSRNFTLNVEEIDSLIYSQYNDYINKNIGSNSILEDFKTEHNRLISLLYDVVSNGIPVIAGGRTKYGYGHAVIIYDAYVDENNNTVLVTNMGQMNLKQQVNFFDEFNVLTDFYYLTFPESFKHECSNNFFNFIRNINLCSCKLSTHIHDYNYQYIDSETHYQKCFCKYVYCNEHIYDHETYINAKLYGLCECGAVKNTNDTPIAIPTGKEEEYV